MNELIKHEDRFPVLIEELQEFILVGKERLNAHKAKIRAIEKIQRAQAAKEAALSDAQDLGEIVLDAEVKLGEMLKAIDKTDSKLKGKDRGSKGGTTKKTLPNGINKKQSHQAQQLAKHPETIEEIKKEAKA